MNMNELNINNVKDLRKYPANRVCAILETDMDARSALDALLMANISEKDIDIFHGDITNRDEEPGFAAKVAKVLRGYGDIENEEIEIYESAIERGGYVFEIHVRSEAEKEIVEHILAQHGAHEINYFGTWYVEAMHEA
jgi:hypothetical protein